MLETFLELQTVQDKLYEQGILAHIPIFLMLEEKWSKTDFDVEWKENGEDYSADISSQIESEDKRVSIFLVYNNFGNELQYLIFKTDNYEGLL